MAVTLLVGGARGGKSALAIEMATRFLGPVTVLATAQALDSEMAERIGRHRRQRPAAWAVVEEPMELVDALQGVPSASFVIVDCLTLWVSNLLQAGLTEEEIERRASSAAGVAAVRCGPTVAVSNEVGWGIVPGNSLARKYRDLLGRVNATWAAASDRVLLVMAGRVVELRSPEAVLGE